VLFGSCSHFVALPAPHYLCSTHRPADGRAGYGFPLQQSGRRSSGLASFDSGLVRVFVKFKLSPLPRGSGDNCLEAVSWLPGKIAQVLFVTFDEVKREVAAAEREEA